MIRITVVVFAAALAGSACVQRRGFVCTEDDQCTLAEGGRCEADDGYCSYPDDGCPSGQRFEMRAPGELGGECVEIDLTCTSYCEQFPAVCDEYAPYPDEGYCVAACYQWPVDAEPAGDTLGCRLSALRQVEDWNPVVNCVRAGPTGGDRCRSPDAPTCATYCETFFGGCNALLAAVAPAATWANGDECLATCGGWYPGAIDETLADSLGCRIYALMSAAALPADAPPEDRAMLCVDASRTGGTRCRLPD